MQAEIMRALNTVLGRRLLDETSEIQGYRLRVLLWIRCALLLDFQLDEAVALPGCRHTIAGTLSTAHVTFPNAHNTCS